jgi:hypothetical protein
MSNSWSLDTIAQWMMVNISLALTFYAGLIEAFSSAASPARPCRAEYPGKVKAASITAPPEYILCLTYPSSLKYLPPRLPPP